MNIVITGGNGFLGSKLAEKFYKEDHNVTIIDKKKNSINKITEQKSKIKFIKANILSQKSLSKIKIKNNSILLHCAGQPSAAMSFQKPLDDMKKNIEGMLNIIDFSKKKKIKKIIFASTFNVYQENNKIPKLKENSVCVPKSLYANSKLSAENYLKVYATHQNIKWNILRMFNIYGPGQDPKNNFLGMISIFLNMAKNQSKIQVKGSLKRFRDFIYIDDVTDAWMRVAKDKKNFNKIYNLGTGSKTSLKKLFQIISKVLNKKLVIEELKGTPGDFMGCYSDMGKIKKDLKFKTKTSLKNGIEKFNNWLNEKKN